MAQNLAMEKKIVVSFVKIINLTLLYQLKLLE